MRTGGKCGQVGPLAKDGPHKPRIHEVGEGEDVGALELGGEHIGTVEVNTAETHTGSWEILEADN